MLYQSFGSTTAADNTVTHVPSDSANHSADTSQRFLILSIRPFIRRSFSTCLNSKRIAMSSQIKCSLDEVCEAVTPSTSHTHRSGRTRARCGRYVRLSACSLRERARARTFSLKTTNFVTQPSYRTRTASPTLYNFHSECFPVQSSLNYSQISIVSVGIRVMNLK